MKNNEIYKALKKFKKLKQKRDKTKLHKDYYFFHDKGIMTSKL